MKATGQFLGKPIKRRRSQRIRSLLPEGPEELIRILLPRRKIPREGLGLLRTGSSPKSTRKTAADIPDQVTIIADSL